MNADKVMGLGPFLLVLPAHNQAVAELPPSEETWDLIIETIQLIRRFNKPELWTDGTF
jgi:hypothetical protein